MWKIYKWDGHYIQGEFISEHTTEAAALKKAKKTIKYLKATKRTSTGPSAQWRRWPSSWDDHQKDKQENKRK